MREKAMPRATPNTCVTVLTDPFINTATRARHARACTADKGEPVRTVTHAERVGATLHKVANSRDTIFALDLGHKTGWALGSPDSGITSGTEEFRHDRWQGGGIKFLRLKRWLTELKGCAGGLDLVVYESVRRHAGVDAGHAYGGWLAILTAWCEHHGIPYQGVPVGTIKRHVTGKGNADKAAVIAAVQSLGFHPQDDNEADALALLHWALAHRAGGAR